MDIFYFVLFGGNIRGMMAAVVLWTAERILRRRGRRLEPAMWAAVFLVQALPADLLLVWMNLAPQGMMETARAIAEAPAGLLAFLLWEAGAVMLLAWRFLQCRRLKWRALEGGMPKEGVYVLEHLKRPAICGYIRPALYLPKEMAGKKAEEAVHKADGLIDSGQWRLWWLCRLITYVHWYQPILWLCLARWRRIWLSDIDEATGDGYNE